MSETIKEETAEAVQDEPQGLTLEKFEEATEVVSKVISETKLVYSEYFSNLTGNKVYLKPENMQYTGAYKVRGAFYKISTLSDEEKQRGLITASAGNHAQGVAYAAKLAGCKATVVMPTTTPLMKVNRTRSYGAEVVLHGDVFDEALAYANELAAEHGYTFIHPFNDLDVATGQGTIAMEIIKELPTVDYILVPIGGGGLCTGVATLAKLLNPKIKVIGVEPAGANCMQESLKEGKVTEEQINAACRRVLEAKYKLGLFSDPYKYCDTLRTREKLYTAEHRSSARTIATETFVLLKNDHHLLPLDIKGKIALIGPMADARNNMCGMWSMTCTPSRHGTLLEGIRSAAGDKAEILYAKGSNIYYDAETEKAATGIRPLERGDNRQLLDEALRIAARADVIVAALGECAEMSGESVSRTNLEIPDAQQDLLKALVKTGKPVVLLLFTGRPLVLNWEATNVHSILNVWFGGSETGDAVADVLFGKVAPSGKLTTTFPRSVGQLPLFYNHLNTGRPDPDNRIFNRYASNYLDESNEPLYPFGYGLSYTDFVYSDLQISSETLPKNGELTVSVTVTNKGNYDGYETVQLYLRDIYAEIARPVKELKGFKRIFLKSGESRDINFVITENDLKFYNSGLEYIYEPGEFDVMVGSNSRDVQTKRFRAE